MGIIMIPIKVKSNKIFTKETLDKCKNSKLAQKTCLKEGCNGLAMGNNYCRWHGGFNDETQLVTKESQRRVRNNNCNRTRQALRKRDKNAYRDLMSNIKKLKEIKVDE
jgi:hypothetical protein